MKRKGTRRRGVRRGSRGKGKTRKWKNFIKGKEFFSLHYSLLSPKRKILSLKNGYWLVVIRYSFDFEFRPRALLNNGRGVWGKINTWAIYTFFLSRSIDFYYFIFPFFLVFFSLSPFTGIEGAIVF